MPLKNIPYSICVSLFFLACISCPATDGSEPDKVEQDNPEPDNPVPDERATINFHNASSYRVDIYKNFNPSSFDPTTWLCSVDGGQLLKVQVYASTDQVVGDTFYPRYKIPITIENTEGAATFYIDAKRTLGNITFVVEKNKTYTKTIPKPLPGQLMPTDGYLTIQNQGDYQIRIENGGILHREDNGSIYLPPLKTGYYKIEFSSFDDTSIWVNQLKAFGTSYVDFPSFSMELGKLYHFTANGNVINLKKISPLLVN
jgi:hypothetical protein